MPNLAGMLGRGIIGEGSKERQYALSGEMPKSEMTKGRNAQERGIPKSAESLRARNP